MLVVADSSPLIALIAIGHIEILPKLFDSVVIPQEIAAELSGSKRPAPVVNFISSPPAWLSVRAPKSVELITQLHAGERAAISLAVEIEADLLLIDDLDGRREAVKRNVPITGTIGILELAASEGLLELGDAFARLKRTDFWISHDLLDERLHLHRSRRRT